MPLLHFIDTGLAVYLLKWGNPEALEKGAMSEALFETCVFTEIYKNYLNAGEKNLPSSATGTKIKRRSIF